MAFNLIFNLIPFLILLKARKIDEVEEYPDDLEDNIGDWCKGKSIIAIGDYNTTATLKTYGSDNLD